MKINAFFKNRLGVSLHNHVWSWGAHDQSAGRIFLRVSSESVVEATAGVRWVIVYDPNWIASSGHSERLQHIELLRNGVKGFAVTAEFNASNKIASFDDETLLELGEIVEEEGLTYARVTGTVPIDEVILGTTGLTSAAKDIEEIVHSQAPATEKKALVAARLGQGAFRAAVLSRWEYCCAVTGIAVSAAIRASHIKPWKASSNLERLDPHNGLPLVATLDALFDVGLITFNHKGKMLVSSALSAVDKKALGIGKQHLVKAPGKKTAMYLSYHRERRFRA